MSKIVYVHSFKIFLMLDSAVFWAPRDEVKLLDTQKQGIIEPALRACGNIATGTDLQTMVLLQSGVLGPLQKVLQSAKKQHKKEALWLISNVTAGTQDQLQMVIDSGLMEVVVASSYDSTQEVCSDERAYPHLSRERGVCRRVSGMIVRGQRQKIPGCYESTALWAVRATQRTMSE